MTLLPVWALKVALLLLLALGATALRHRRSAAVRHWVLASAGSAALLLPIVGAALPPGPCPFRRRGWPSRRRRRSAS
jgi:hypothetical protein